MSKPRFANKWYKTPPVAELRQEVQKVYDDLTATESDINALEANKVGNAGSVPSIAAGAADSTDADGNPTPNTTDFPPADYAEGTLFFATSYPAGVDGGSMQFRLEDGAWVWRWGKFVASNSNGSYERDADGGQRCWRAGNSIGTVTAGTYTTTVTFAATFVVIPFVSGRAHENIAGGAIVETFESVGDSVSQGKVRWKHSWGGGINIRVDFEAIGRWK